MDTIERFHSKYFIAPDSCWIWLGGLDRGGYSQFYDSRDKNTRRNLKGHQFSYLLHVGSIPKNFVIDHLCRQRSCVNPYHLEAVTPKENVLRGVGVAAKNAKKTHCKRGHKFTEENTYTYRNMRSCRKCTYDKIREFRRKNKLADSIEAINGNN